MPTSLPRRRLLAAAAAGTAGALAGCSSLPFTGGSNDDSPARDWLYDPDEYVEGDEFHLGMQFRSPSRLAAVEDELHDEATGIVAPVRTDQLDADDVDWSVQVAEQLLNGPFVLAHGGSFDADDARDAAAGRDVDESVGEDVGSVGDLDVFEYEAGRFGAAAAGQAVTVDGPSDLDVEAFVADGTDGSPGLLDHVEAFEGLLDALRFDHTANVTFGSGDDGPFGNGYGYTIDGDRTEIRWGAYDSFDASEMTETVEEVDALDDVTTEEEGDLVVVSATADTDVLALNGTVIQLLQAPYE